MGAFLNFLWSTVIISVLECNKAMNTQHVGDKFNLKSDFTIPNLRLSHQSLQGPQQSATLLSAVALKYGPPSSHIWIKLNTLFIYSNIHKQINTCDDRRNVPRRFAFHCLPTIGLSYVGYIERLNFVTQILSVSDRAGLIDNAFNLARSSLVSYDVPLRLASYLDREEHYTPWRSFDISIGFIKKMLISSVHYGQWQVRGLLSEVVARTFVAPINVSPSAAVIVVLRQSWGVWGGRDPPDLEVGVVEGVVSGLLRSKGRDGNPGPPPPVFKPD
jgi:hypothetical protein